MKILRQFDPASLVTIMLTFILFAVALFEKGFTHDLLLEAGVFLVSIKLILMSYKQHVSAAGMEESLEEVKKTLRRMEAERTS